MFRKILSILAIILYLNNTLAADDVVERFSNQLTQVYRVIWNLQAWPPFHHIVSLNDISRFLRSNGVNNLVNFMESLENKKAQTNIEVLKKEIERLQKIFIELKPIKASSRPGSPFRIITGGEIDPEHLEKIKEKLRTFLIRESLILLFAGHVLGKIRGEKIPGVAIYMSTGESLKNEKIGQAEWFENLNSVVVLLQKYAMLCDYIDLEFPMLIQLIVDQIEYLKKHGQYRIIQDAILQGVKISDHLIPKWNRVKECRGLLDPGMQF